MSVYTTYLDEIPMGRLAAKSPRALVNGLGARGLLLGRSSVVMVPCARVAGQFVAVDASRVEFQRTTGENWRKV